MIGIYIHIPYCLRKCDYCDFYSLPTMHDEVPHEAYGDALEQQLLQALKAHDVEGRTVETIYFGGGTPSLMPSDFFGRVIGLVRQRFSLARDVEVSCEVNPACADRTWLQGVKQAGINRISLGIQSFQSKQLEALGRVQTPDEAMCAIAEAQDVGFGSVSLDLMFGIPGETMRDLEEDLRIAMTFQPEHLSVYQLTIEDGTPLCDRLSKGMHAHRLKGVQGENGQMPSEDDLLGQMRTAARMLSRGGWHRYEISNYAKPGSACRHNMQYWRYGEYVGLGAGATSFFRMGRETFVSKGEHAEARSPCATFARRFTQTRDVGRYCAGSGELAEDEMIDRKTAMAEYCFMGLRTIEGISAQAFLETFGISLASRYADVLERAIAAHLLEEGGGCFRLTPKGIELSNQLFEQFLP